MAICFTLSIASKKHFLPDFYWPPRKDYQRVIFFAVRVGIKDLRKRQQLKLLKCFVNAKNETKFLDEMIFFLDQASCVVLI